MSDELKRALGSKIRAARKRAGLTQDELAAQIGKSPESISNIERGRQLPMLDTVAALATALQVPMAELFEWSDHTVATDARLRAEAQFRELSRQLDDESLALAVEQLEVFVRALKQR